MRVNPCLHTHLLCAKITAQELTALKRSTLKYLLKICAVEPYKNNFITLDWMTKSVCNPKKNRAPVPL